MSHATRVFPLGFRNAVSILISFQDEGPWQQAHALAASHRLPLSSLAKQLQSLARAGLLESSRGANGGFRLARPAHQILLADILAALQPGDRRPACMLRQGACTPGHPCALHSFAETLRNLVDHMLRTTTLKDLQVAEQANPWASLDPPSPIPIS